MVDPYIFCQIVVFGHFCPNKYTLFVLCAKLSVKVQ